LRAPAGIRLKGSTLRSYIKAVEADWTEWKHMLAINNAIESLWGMNGVRDYARRTIAEMKGFHLTMLEGLLRLFGASPPTIFERLNDSIKNTCEGIDYQYQPLTDRSGIMEVHYAVAEEIPTSIFIGAIATLQEILRICGATGVVGNPERLSPTSARYAIRW
jgi:hypothetical protein